MCIGEFKKKIYKHIDKYTDNINIPIIGTLFYTSSTK